MRRVKYTYPKKWPLLLLPLLYLSLSIIFLSGIKHFYIGHFDPAYGYLLNATNIASGHFRTGIDGHPGTPVKIFAAIIVFIRHLFNGNTILYQDVLDHPETYLFAISAVFALILLLSTYFAGIYVFRNTGNLGLALLFQASPLFYGSILNMTISLSAESALTTTGIFFIAYLYVNTTGRNQTDGNSVTNKNSIIFGLFTALLITTKIYCAPFIVMVVFLIQRRKQIVVYLFSTGLFSLLFLFPLYNQFHNWLGSIKSMVFHTGSYGQGSLGIVDKALYKSNLIEIFTKHFLFTSVYIVAIAAFLITLFRILKKKPSLPGLIFPITGVVIFFSLFIVLIAKQYKIIYPEPLTHILIPISKFYYFIPLIICFPLFIALSNKILSPFISLKFYHRYKHAVHCGVLAVIIAGGVYTTFGACYYDARIEHVSLEKTSAFLNEWKNTPVIIVTDGDKVCPEPALFLGASYSGHWDSPQYFDFLKKNYPDSYLYTTWSDELIFWNHATDIPTILEKSKQALVYISNTDSVTEASILSRICSGMIEKKEIACSKIYSSENKYENIYLLKSASR